MFEKWRIKEHMEVADSGGQHVGTVDSVDDGRIKLTRSDSDDAIHHYIDIDLVDRIDDNRVYLKPGTPQPFTSEARLAEPTGSVNAGTNAAQDVAIGATTSGVDLPGTESKLFGTSGHGTGMGGSGVN